MTEFAEQAQPKLQSGGRQAIGWFRRMDSERDNLEAALAFATQDETSVVMALRLFSAQLPYWVNRGLWSAGRNAADLLAHSPHAASAPTLKRAVAMGGAGQLCYLCADHVAAHRHLSKACALLESIDDQARLARALQPLGLACSELRRYDEADRHLSRALELSQRTHQPEQEVSSLVALAMLRRVQGQSNDAEALCLRALALCEAQDQAASRAMIQLNLAMMQIDRGDSRAARSAALEALDLLGEVISPIHAVAALDVALAIAVATDDGGYAARWNAGAQHFCNEALFERHEADEAFAARWRARMPAGIAPREWSDGDDWPLELANWLRTRAATTGR
jgi:tetratricopeptide (TPR) repeat protein